MSAKVIWPLTLLLITPFNTSLFSNDSCLSHHFYGNYKDGQTILSVLRPDAACLLDSRITNTIMQTTTVAESTQEIPQLVWLQELDVDESLKSRVDDFDIFLNRILAKPSLRNDDAPAQVTMNSIHAPLYSEIFYRSTSAALISVSHAQARNIDVLVPRFWKSTLLPMSPVPFQPVAHFSLKHAESILAGLKFNPVIASTVDNISVSQMLRDIRFLTGEDGKSGIISRHSFSPGALTAASWLKTQFEDTGAKCILKPFLAGFAPNVICRYSALENTTSTVLFSAHYDSRGSFGQIRAPGADDDGSGIVALLSIARTILRKKVKFYSNVEIVAFAGEEQGLLGSRAYARELRAANANLTIMVQADMLAYRSPGEPRQLGLPDVVGSPVVAQLVANVSALYSPELRVGLTPVCCSDHQSFHEQGFPATHVFERVGLIVDPMYHNSGDLSERVGYDFEQIKSIAKVQFATLLHTAGFELSD